MSDKPGMSSPPEGSEMLADETNTQSTQQIPTPPPPKPVQPNPAQPNPVLPKQEADWSLGQEVKEWGKTAKDSLLGTADVDPQEEIKRQMDEQKRIANLKQFYPARLATTSITPATKS